ncbi:NiFeSe hydrogenase maturation protease [Oleidesulfovibrio sp.]|uniref:NiFeSe hydrogenase maturation protease n=1 Tax=Oleidesulfovibrio sp. TaxID=2909707 RepID=UPI003A8C467F
MPRLLVLGIGNSLLTDDGVGVFAAEALQKETWPENVTIMEGGTFTQDIFYLFEGYDRLLVLDVIHAGHAPGTIYRLTEEDLIQKDNQRLSIHDVDLIDSLKMAELRGKRPYLQVVGMEPQDITTWNIGLSEPCQEKFEKFLDVAREDIHKILQEMA